MKAGESERGLITENYYLRWVNFGRLWWVNFQRRLTAMDSEAAVTAALYSLCGRQPITADAVKEILHAHQPPASHTEVGIAEVDLAMYDILLLDGEVSYAL